MTDGITLHVVEAGPRDGRPIFLLHGFPEFWWGWRHQVEPIARAGYRVIVPDQRGYNLSEKPEGVDAYSLDRLAGDITRLADNRQLSTFAVAGHDWGGMVAWWLAGTRPDRVSRLIAINAPHPAIVRAYALRHPGQLLRSAYAAFFQLPWLPEAVLRAADFRLMKRSMRNSSRPGTFSEADLDRYREAWSEPGALTAMLNWYRALRRSPVAAQRVTVPALVIWGIRDRFLQRGLADASLALCDRGRIVQVDASHWVQHEEPARVNAAILEFLAQ
jgi:pimeloyl-ACP methyl ester carboxylesterase